MRKVTKFMILPYVFSISVGLVYSSDFVSVKESLKNTVIIAIPENGRPVDRTVAQELKQNLLSDAQIITATKKLIPTQSGVIRIAIDDEKFTNGPRKISADKDWMYFKLSSSGDGEIVTSKPHLLYSLFCQIRDEWLNENITEFVYIYIVIKPGLGIKNFGSLYLNTPKSQ